VSEWSGHYFSSQDENSYQTSSAMGKVTTIVKQLFFYTLMNISPPVACEPFVLQIYNYEADMLDMLPLEGEQRILFLVQLRAGYKQLTSKEIRVMLIFHSWHKLCLQALSQRTYRF